MVIVPLITQASRPVTRADCHPPLRENAAARKTNKTPRMAGLYLPGYIALTTLSERKQRVQAYTRRGEPSTIAFTRLTLGFHILLLRLWEWETLIPNVTPLPQISHFAIFCTSFYPEFLSQHSYFIRFSREMQVFFRQ
jgi:hypothetical protein